VQFTRTRPVQGTTPSVGSQRADCGVPRPRHLCPRSNNLVRFSLAADIRGVTLACYRVHRGAQAKDRYGPAMPG
jgi:hypothetical protein